MSKNKKHRNMTPNEESVEKETLKEQAATAAEATEAAAETEKENTTATPEEEALEEVDELSQAKADLAEAREKMAEQQDRYLRLAAEFDNFRKRSMKEKSELIQNASAGLMTAVLPILDDMDRAMDSLDKTNDTAACCEGFRIIARSFRNILEQNGLKQMETIGETFDADFHEAVAIIPAPTEEQKGKIIDCIQPGYRMNDRVIRHPKVVVGQ